MKPKISLITLGVKDLEKAKAFYEDGLGFPTFGNNEGVVFFELDGTWLSLFPRKNLAEDASVSEKGSGFEGITLAHNVRSREEVAKVLALAERAGGTIVKPAQDASWGGHHGYFKDLDGHLWEVAWNPYFDLT